MEKKVHVTILKLLVTTLKSLDCECEKLVYAFLYSVNHVMNHFKKKV